MFYLHGKIIAGDTNRTLCYHTLAMSLPATGATSVQYPASVKCGKFRLYISGIRCVLVGDFGPHKIAIAVSMWSLLVFYMLDEIFRNFFRTCLGNFYFGLSDERKATVIMCSTTAD